MQIISSMILLGVICTKYSLRIPGDWYELLTRMSRSEWFMEGAHLKNIIVGASCELLARNPCSKWFMRSNCSFWALNVSYGLENLDLNHSYRALTWRSYVRCLTQITSSEKFPRAVWTKYWLKILFWAFHSNLYELLARSGRMMQVAGSKIFL